MTALEELSQFVKDLNLEDFSDKDVNHMKGDVLDSLGCGLIGSTTDWAKIMRKVVAKWGGEPSSLVWGTKEKLPSNKATLANGTAVQALEFDNSHTPLGLHLGSSVLPAAFSVAERQGSSGEELLLAVTAGYEVSIRIRGAMDITHIRRGFNSTGTC